MPWQATFWTKGFGMLTDKFGIGWMVMAPEQPN
jgi:PhnB protein